MESLIRPCYGCFSYYRSIIMNILFQRKIKEVRAEIKKDVYEINTPEKYIIEEGIVKVRPWRMVVVSEGDVIDGAFLTSSKVVRDESGRMVGVEEYTIPMRPNTIMTNRAINLEITTPWGYEEVWLLHIVE